HGPVGLRAIAERVHRKTAQLANGLEQGGYKVQPAQFFDCFTVEVGPMQGAILEAGRREGINFRKVGADRIGLTLDETTRGETLEAVWRAFGLNIDRAGTSDAVRLPAELARESEYLTHPVFHMNRAETEM